MTYLENNSAAVTLSWLKKTFHQPFGDLPASCEEADKKVRQVRLCIEVLHHQTDPLETLAIIKSRYQYKHLIVTLMVAEKRQEFGLLDGIGSIAVAHEDAIKATDGALVTFVDHDPLSTWIIHYENKSPAKRRKA